MYLGGMYPREGIAAILNMRIRLWVPKDARPYSGTGAVGGPEFGEQGWLIWEKRAETVSFWRAQGGFHVAAALRVSL